MRRLVISAAVLGLVIVSTPAMASGSRLGSGTSSAPRISDAERLANRGRTQVSRKITCKKCEYHDRLNRQTAPEVAQAVRDGRFGLNQRNQQAVLAYLRQRYGV